jgi:hypothetical protein
MAFENGLKYEPNDIQLRLNLAATLRTTGNADNAIHGGKRQRPSRKRSPGTQCLLPTTMSSAAPTVRSAGARRAARPWKSFRNSRRRRLSSSAPAVNPGRAGPSRRVPARAGIRGVGGRGHLAGLGNSFLPCTSASHSESLPSFQENRESVVSPASLFRPH